MESSLDEEFSFITLDNKVLEFYIDRLPIRTLLHIKIDENYRGIKSDNIDINASYKILKIVQEYTNEGILRICSSSINIYQTEEIWKLDSKMLAKVLMILSVSEDYYFSLEWMKIKLEEDWAVHNNNYTNVYIESVKYENIIDMINANRLIKSGIEYKSEIIKFNELTTGDLYDMGSFGISKIINPIQESDDLDGDNYLFYPLLETDNKYMIWYRGDLFEHHEKLGVNLHNYGNNIYGLSDPDFPEDVGIYFTTEDIENMSSSESNNLLKNIKLASYRIAYAEDKLPEVLFDKRVPYVYKCSYIYISSENVEVSFTLSWLYCIINNINLIELNMINDDLYSILIYVPLNLTRIINITTTGEDVPSLKDIKRIIPYITSRPKIDKDDLFSLY